MLKQMYIDFCHFRTVYRGNYCPLLTLLIVSMLVSKLHVYALSNHESECNVP